MKILSALTPYVLSISQVVLNDEPLVIDALHSFQARLRLWVLKWLKRCIAVCIITYRTDLWLLTSQSSRAFQRYLGLLVLSQLLFWVFNAPYELFLTVTKRLWYIRESRKRVSRIICHRVRTVHLGYFALPKSPKMRSLTLSYILLNFRSVWW